MNQILTCHRLVAARAGTGSGHWKTVWPVSRAIDWALHANEGPREKQLISYAANGMLICQPKHLKWSGKPCAEVPVIARDAGAAVFKCPAFVSAPAAGSLSLELLLRFIEHAECLYYAY
eukprot:1890922-Pleurochrysis_carterae.AAC.2